MGDSISVRCTLNREHLPPNRKAVVYLALDVTPPGTLSGAGLPSAICLLIDRSGSMEGEKLDQAKLAVSESIKQLQPTDYVGIIAFAGNVDKISSMEKVQSANLAGLERKVKGLQTEGSTELYRGLETAYQELIRATKGTGNLVKRIILLSDGQPTDEREVTEYAELARTMREHGISIQTLGIGPDYNEDLLGAIAERSGGVWRHITSARDISNFFSKQVQESKTVVHIMPEVLIHLTRGVELIEVYKAMPDVYPVSNLKQSGNEVRIPISDIKAGEAQTLAAKISVPPKPEGQFRLARVELAGEPATEVDVVANFTNDERLWGIENNAFPRGIFLTAETQVLVKKALSGDKAALTEANRKKETILKDSSLTQIRTIHDTIVKTGETIVKAKTGMSQEETKVEKAKMTEIRRS